jgi:UDP:flavonoid glycosyltransferase YjiC (YdhE family)
MGHVMRCLALAQSWIGFGGTVRLACTAVPPAIAGLLERQRGSS